MIKLQQIGHIYPCGECGSDNVHVYASWENDYYWNEEHVICHDCGGYRKKERRR